MQTNRPIIKIKKKGIDHALEWLSWVLVVFIWIFCISHYPKLPDIIPVHYGSDGMADGYGSKSTIFLIPGILTAMVVLLKVINLYPHRFNYLATINEENAEAQYNSATRLMRYLQAFIPSMFLYIVIKEVTDAGKKTSKLEPWFLLLLIPGIMIPTVYTVYTSLTKKTK